MRAPYFPCCLATCRIVALLLASGFGVRGEPAQIVVQRGPQLEVATAVYSPGGRIIASAGEGDPIQLWDRATGDLLRTLRCHPQRVFGLAFSPDRKLLASSGIDGRVRLWDYRQGRLLRVFTNHLGHWARRVAFSPDSRLLAAATYDGSVSVWDVASGRVVRTLPVKQPVSDVLFTPDGRFLVAALRSDTSPLIEFWNVTSGQLGLVINATNFVYEMSISRDGRRLASCGARSSANVWDLPGGRLLRAFHPGGNVYSAAISPDGRRVAFGGHFVNSLWSVSSGALLCRMRGQEDAALQMSFSPDGRELMSACADASIRLWNGASGKLKRVIAPRPPDRPVTSIAFSPDGAWEAIGAVDGVVRVWNARTDAFKNDLRGHAGPVTALAFSPDSRWLCSGSVDRTMRVWDMAHGTISAIHPYYHRTDPIGLEAFGGTEGLVATACGPWMGTGTDHDVTLWETHLDQPTRVLRGHTAQICALAFAHGVDLLASASVDGTIKLWSSRTGGCLATLTNESAEVLAFSPDARWLVAGMADGRVRVLGTNDLEAVRTWQAHQRAVQSLVFSSDGRWLATASPDRTAAVWDWASGREVRRFTNVTSQYLPLAFQPGQPILAFAKTDDLIVHVNVETGAILFQRELFPDGSWLAWNPAKPFYQASAHGEEHARLRFANQLAPVYPLALYRRELRRSTNFLAALAGPVPGLEPKDFQLWWYRYPYKADWFYSCVAALSAWMIVRLRRGWVAERRRRQQENVSRQLLMSQEAERKRIAAELHDSLGQNLLIIKNRLHLAQQSDGGAASAEQLREISETVTHTIREIGEITHHLRPYQLDRLGLTKAVRSVVKKIADSGFLQLENQLADIDGLFPPENEINFYRIVQECLNNMIKHSHAAWGRITIRRTRMMLAMTIEDDGKGFDYRQTVSEAQPARGFGLTGLGERVRILGGRFACDSAPGLGTRLTFEIPIPAKNGGLRMDTDKRDAAMPRRPGETAKIENEG